MSDPRSLIDLTQVKPPQTDPSDTLDSRAKEERKEFRHPRLTPTDRLENALKDYIASLGKALGDRIEALEDDKRQAFEREADLLESCRKLQGDLDRLTPE